MKKLEEMLESVESDIKRMVIYDALEHGEHGSINYLKDVVSHGCISGTVSGLVYYADTHKFFDTHYEEIMEAVDEYEESIGEKVRWEGDLKNWFAWFGYEWFAREILDELEEEY
jgi:hypothetical protein